ncbi:MAG: hypothetical protein EA362_03505 [Saprospirales bacterium]|nr:MAG: hypothetical protein EA362_03505 [Saprospirales bacterium]
MKNAYLFLILLGIFIGLTGFIMISENVEEDWGFYAHRKLNRLAVFTLPPQMMPLFKTEIEYLSAHAVDPDRRRYATPHEGPRHFIDVDVWGDFPFPDLPRGWHSALAQYSSVAIINDCVAGIADTQVVYFPFIPWDEIELGKVKSYGDYTDLLELNYRPFFNARVPGDFFSPPWIYPLEEWKEGFQAFAKDEFDADCYSVWIADHLTQYGILPYFLPQIMRQLTNAMRRGDKARILRFAADIGHYIGDAHVPLHTTINYNGQLTGQDGIHAFWESRIPELFAEDFDLIVGKAQYIEDKEEFFWDIILDTHMKVDSVLSIERYLRDTYPQDAQMCFDDRLFQTIRQPCREFAAEYERLMNGMVERQMRKTIFAIGSVWYTAWVDAGQPDFRSGELTSDETHLQESDSLRIIYRRGSIYGREHLNN